MEARSTLSTANQRQWADSLYNTMNETNPKLASRSLGRPHPDAQRSCYGCSTRQATSRTLVTESA